MRYTRSQGLRKEIAAYYKDGISQNQIAKLVNRPRQTVRYHLRACGLLTDEHKYKGRCCVCGAKAEEGVPVCLNPYCIGYWTDSEDCNPNSAADLHIMKIEAPAEVEFPDTAVFCKLDPDCKRVFAHQADHIRFHYYRRLQNSRVQAGIKVPQPIYYSGQNPRGRKPDGTRGRIKPVYIRREHVEDGKHLRHIRESKNLSRAELAFIAHVAVSSLLHYETGRRVPGIYPALRIASALKMDPSKIWKAEEE